MIKEPSKMEKIAFKKGYTMTEIAKTVGLHKSTISKIANGYRKALPETEEKITEMLGTDKWIPKKSA